MTQTLGVLTLGAQENATHCIIWLHGLGADAHDFEPLIPHLALRKTTRVILPNAPIRPITINGGMPMRGWYDIHSISRINDDAVGIAESHQAIYTCYIQEINRGILADHIIFAGFSQGGVMALDLGLNHHCAGILALSCYLYNPDAVAHPSLKPPSILQIHGTHDEVVPYALGRSAWQVLIQRGYPVQWKNYTMRHEICAEEIDAIRQWLQSLGC